MLGGQGQYVIMLRCQVQYVSILRGQGQFLAPGALEAPQVLSVKIPVEKSIDLGLLEPWKLHSSFL